MYTTSTTKARQLEQNCRFDAHPKFIQLTHNSSGARRLKKKKTSKTSLHNPAHQVPKQRLGRGKTYIMHEYMELLRGNDGRTPENANVVNPENSVSRTLYPPKPTNIHLKVHPNKAGSSPRLPSKMLHVHTHYDNYDMISLMPF